MPLPLLILIPIIGLAGAWWYERQKSAAAAALPGAIAAAAASQPASGAPASAIWIHPSGAIMSSTPGGALGSLVLTPVGTGALQAMAAALNASIANEASNLLSQIPGHLPGDAYDLNRQVIVISLQQLIAAPSKAKLQQTISTLIQNKTQTAVDVASQLKAFSPHI